MLYGICNLSIVALRKEASHKSEMTNQVLFGEHFEILENQQKWSRIKLAFDGFEGFIDNKQFTSISYKEYQMLSEGNVSYSAELVDFITNVNNELTTITIGAVLPLLKETECELSDETYSYQGAIFSGKLDKSAILKTSFTFLNCPYLCGGKSPFGIDCSAFTQMVYKLCGYQLQRNVIEQAAQGEVLSFIEESEPGDLAFFDNEEGEIVHVGVILNNYNIIHVHDKVRIDSLDHSGIFNTDLQKHTHKLRVIKKIV
ncbi:NlpC/P60 family protein [uncultured Polaribacter sp.]|uniref:C40 family peptidase n=1 Tax=uncultured Polaribacter sp. TaxID=174711 RepID=UPI00260D12AE|nr:NlpC/P60 family protein [uncultured Polaribacter sp.]